MSNEVYIVDYLRSPFSRSRPTKPETDVFDKITMGEVVGNLLKQIIERTGVDPEEINDVITGCTMQMKENWTLGGRAIVFAADLPVTVPAQGVDRVCCSGMSALHQCAMEIMLGYSDIVFACGMEHMTHLPLQFEHNPHLGVTPAAMRPERLQRYDLMTAMSMGLTAEKLFEECSEKYGTTREDMDHWGVRSHNLAEKAIEEGYFKDEIMPVRVKLADGSEAVIEEDQAVRKGATYEATAGLKPAFKANGAVTAGNSSPLNAGGVAVLMMSEKKMKEMNLEPMARVVSLGWAGVEPNVMGKGPVPASRMALKHAGLEAKDIEFWEINEAFAIVPIYAIKNLEMDPEKVNVKGGAIAIGHPLAASGPRLTGTLARIMKENNARYGAATLCGGGGQGATTIIERV